MSRERAPAEEQDIAPRRREQNERTEDGDPRIHPPSNEVTSTKTRTRIPYLLRVFQFFAILRNKSGRLLRVFVFRCDARNRNHRDTRESKHSRPIGRAIGSLQYLRCVALIPQPASRCAFSTGMQSPAQFHYRRCRQLALQTPRQRDHATYRCAFQPPCDSTPWNAPIQQNLPVRQLRVASFRQNTSPWQ